MKSGILVLYKEKNMTSHDAVNIVRRLFSTKKVGHTGTLDPQATGVLPILVGNAVKISEFAMCEKKKYVAEITFGTFTDTEDKWGKVTSSSDKRCEKAEFEEALFSFVGEYMQTPPMMSALKVNGKKLYELARLGIEVERKKRKCEIFSVSLLYFDKERAEITVECSKGTYIRTFIFDLCTKIGIKGCMSALERVESMGFDKSCAVTLSELEAISPEEREMHLIPTEDFFKKLKIVSPEPFYLRLIKNGCSVELKKMKLDLCENEMVRLYDENGFFALGKVILGENSLELKKIKEINS